eukprot:TRINITY_DN30360_c0_g1_i5.p2 TRINITY_DN30360_c0_g1~~TRINITY_DN30360_c0_g1_i5.p2  ORF type:complete len:207 (+),score=33.68 TRINITY_DN30360_c0_g1_i5:94-714(+)
MSWTVSSPMGAAAGNACGGTWIYIHELPRLQEEPNSAEEDSSGRSRGTIHKPQEALQPLVPCHRQFNASKAYRLFGVRSICGFAANGYFGEAIAWASRRGESSLFRTWTFSLEEIWLARLSSACRADTPEAADLFLVPYPATALFHAIRFGSISRTAAARYHRKVQELLRGSAAWQRCGGCDHLLVLGRVAGDFLPKRLSRARSSL